ncbi:phosphatase PAP2 family protein [uncultured Paludibaculum sp.]|uniref:phosphatase PAP2 family protein n=1 Tax=uncultured Paludibaculum sp. TaxID=1765020 RepID=UPI002AAC3B46|nr:phosphatase PAP2 family protein [uncultured Paludibaculum sp.]
MQPEIRINEGGPGTLTESGTTNAAPNVWSTQLASIRPSEWVLILFFLYTAVLSSLHGMPPTRLLAAFAAPAILVALAWAADASPRRAVEIARDWAPAPLVLLAYWQMDWFASTHTMRALEIRWNEWDRVLLDAWSMRAVIESQGRLIPSILELAYSLLYTIPPLSIAALYIYRRRRMVDRLLLPYLLSTLLVYALLPLAPSASPRLEFPGLDLPTIDTVFRRFNLWVLSWGDIRTGVFPSGHVSTAFSCALGMRYALPERPWVSRVLLIMALLITVATVYGRYHYAVDGAASIVISFTALGISRRICRD